MIANNRVFLLTDKRSFGESCYKHLCSYDSKLKVTLYLDFEKCLAEVRNKNVDLILVDKKIEELAFNSKLMAAVDSQEQIIYLGEKAFDTPDSVIMHDFNLSLKTFFQDGKSRQGNTVKDRIRAPDILAIGASTGGPAALLDLFADINTGLPFPIVIVNHIPPGEFSKSLAASISYNSKVKVHSAEHGMILKKGEAYICPGGKHLTVKKIKGQLKYAACLTDQAPPGSCTPSIDLTFASLSQLKFTNAAAIILTGMGRDGTKGAIELSKNNGCIYAQNPENCLITSMPKSVIESGCTSKELDLNELTYHINKKIFSFNNSQSCLLRRPLHQKNKAVNIQKKSSGDIKPSKVINENEVLVKFKRILESETENMGESDTPATLKRKLESLLKKFSVNDFDELYKLAMMKNSVKQAVIDHLTNHETFFFRDSYPYEFIQNVVAPDHIKKGENCRIWSAACSTGQEPYSLAMTLSSHIESHKLNMFKIMASDISRASLKQASNGIYSDSELKRGLPSKYLKYFSKKDSSYEINKSLKNLIEFRQVNLGQVPMDFPKFDVILLRYVLIYFDDHKKQIALSKVINHLKPGGYLILDPATSLKVKQKSVKPLRYKSQTIFIKQGGRK
jgi:chemotaxis methyl-accepting protein methylase/chemotaxis response regulator CheB